MVDQWIFLKVDVESLLMSVAVVKDIPKCDDWIFSDLNVNVNEFVETNKKIVLQLNAKSYTQDATSLSTCISDVLMNEKNSFPKFKQKATLGAAGQYSAILNYMMTKKTEIKVAYITEYEPLVKHFLELLWQIGPHYLKVKKREMFLKTVERSFLGINDPSKHKHAVKKLMF